MKTFIFITAFIIGIFLYSESQAVVRHLHIVNCEGTTDTCIVKKLTTGNVVVPGAYVQSGMADPGTTGATNSFDAVWIPSESKGYINLENGYWFDHLNGGRFEVVDGVTLEVFTYEDWLNMQ